MTTENTRPLPDKNEYLNTFAHHAKGWEDEGRRLRRGYWGVPVGAGLGILGHMTKNPVGRASLYAAGLGVGAGGLAAGYLGERGMEYGKGLKTIHKHLSGQPVSEKEWDHLIMNNPSGSLMRHVHPEHRPELAQKWKAEYARFHGKHEKTSFWQGFEKRAFAFMHFVHHAGLSDEEQKGLEKAVHDVGEFRHKAFNHILGSQKAKNVELGGKNNWAEDVVQHFHKNHPQSKQKVWLGSTIRLADKKTPHPNHTEVLAVNNVAHAAKAVMLDGKAPSPGEGAEYYANHVGAPHKVVADGVMGKKYKKAWSV